MRILYTFFIHCLYAGIWVFSFFIPKAKQWIVGRKNQLGNLPKLDKSRKVIWFHCASLGEFDQGLPLMNKLKENDPTLFLLVTFFSPSGFEHYKKRKNKVDYACYIPLDTPKNAKQFLAHFKPKQAFFVKYEFWSNFILEAKKNKTELYSVCTIFREKHRFFRWYGSFFRKTLSQFDYFFVQNQESFDLLNSIGIQKAKIVGDLRFDRVIEHKNSIQKDLVLEQFISSEKIWVLGSTWTLDESFLEKAIRNFEGQLILAPHDISEKHLIEIENRFLEETIRYTKFEIQSSKKIIILDCIGKLANAYSYGTFAYVGGGFTGSLHNILEPAVFGLPVIFGPKHARFPEASYFIEERVGFSVATEEELESVLNTIYTNSSQIKSCLGQLISKNSGVSESIYQKLIGLKKS